MYQDQFELLALSDIDAVLIATGGRWHSPMSILAAQQLSVIDIEHLPCGMDGCS
jgi:hypothetical protein